MTVKLIKNDKVHIIASVKVTAGPLEIFCLDIKTGISYTEHVSEIKFGQRVRKTNKRIYMSHPVIRSAIANDQPAAATLGVVNFDDKGSGSDSDSESNIKIEDAEQGQPQQSPVLVLKYHMGPARVVLNWQWHLSVISAETFYQALVKDSLHAASYLSNTVNELVDVIKKKDIELKQYCLEGAKLRRTTVATEYFDETNYQKKHKSIMDEVSNYGHVERALISIGDVETAVEEITAKEIKPEPSVSPTVEQTKNNSKRSRKRKALESKKKHVELKAKQRRNKPTMQFKDSQSQEDDLNAVWKFEDEDVKPKHDPYGLLNGKPKAGPVKVKQELAEAPIDKTTDGDDNIFDIMAMINSTAKKSSKVFKYTKNGN